MVKSAQPENVQALPQVAVIGSGYWGKNLVRNFHDIQALAAVCESDQKIIKSLRDSYPGLKLLQDFQDVLRDSAIQAVAISTPAETHADLVRQALSAGKDVFVEKPLCLSVEEGRDLVALAQKKSKILMVGHLLWYHPAVLKLKQLIDEGALGRIQYIYSNRLNMGKIRREENILWSFAPHDISVILGLVGETPVQVQAQGGNYLHPNIADVTVSLLSFPSGIKAHIFVSWLHPYKEQKLIVVGDKKMAVFDDMEKKDKLLLYPHSIEWIHQVPVANKAEAESVTLASTEPLRSECLHFLECIRTRTPPRTDGKEGVTVLSVLHQCQKALEAGSAQKSVDSPVKSAAPSPSFFVHPSAFVDEPVDIGEGTSIWHVSHILKGSRIGKNCKIGQNVVIGPKAVIGNNVKIQNNVSVYEGVTLEDYVFCGPSMVFTNVYNPRSAIPRMQELRPTLVRKGTTLGANCTIVCGITIGEYAFVGAGSVVTRDVPNYALMVGSPAQIKGWVCECGNKLTWDGEQSICACGRQYVKSGSVVSPVNNHNN